VERLDDFLRSNGMLGEQSPAVPAERPIYKSSIHPTRW
jgi:hypothetical protein